MKKGDFREEVDKFFKYIYIPTSLLRPIRILNKEDLKKVYSDPKVAVEILYLVLSNLSNTYSRISRADLGSRAEQGYKRLNAQILGSQTRVGRVHTYKKALELLVDKGFIEMGLGHSKEEGRSREYRICKKYFNYRISKYKPKEEETLKILNRNKKRYIKSSGENILVRYFIDVNQGVTYPSNEEAVEILKEAQKEGFKNRRGQRLRTRGKKGRGEFKNAIFTEDYLEIYKFHRDCLTVPIVTGERAGGRVITPLNMMPRMIRKHVKLDGENIVELDFSCLHPNIVNTIYGDGKEVFSHEMVSKELGISREEAKIEHLSFFNKKWSSMYISPLFKYYTQANTSMMEALHREKEEFGHRETSKRLFKVETELMTEIAKEFIKEGIRGFYVFDAMYVKESQKEEARKIMNRVAEEFSINTKVN